MNECTAKVEKARAGAGRRRPGEGKTGRRSGRRGGGGKVQFRVEGGYCRCCGLTRRDTVHGYFVVLFKSEAKNFLLYANQSVPPFPRSPVTVT